MSNHGISVLTGAVVLILGLAGAANATSNENTDSINEDFTPSRSSETEPARSCQRTIDTTDYAAVCCRVIRPGGNVKYLRTNRKKCLAIPGAIVSRSLCTRRSRSGKGGLVCCETDTTPVREQRLNGPRE